MGKVGSLAVLAILEKRKMNVYHEHNFTLTHSEAVGIVRNFDKYSSLKAKIKEQRNKIFPSQRLREFKAKKRLKIITLIREPISRNLSLCFQHFQDFIRDDVTNRNFNDHRSSFELCSYYFENKINSTAGIKWFDSEFFPTTGIDIYNYPFDTRKGHSIINEGKYDILVLQVEKLNQSIDIIQSFLELKTPLQRKEVNIGNKKWYRLLYDEFIRKYTFSTDYIDKMYNSKFMKHFYSEADINMFKEKWDIKKHSQFLLAELEK